MSTEGEVTAVERTTEGQKRFDAKQAELAAKVIQDATLEAAGDAESVIALLQARWGDAGFTPEQCVYSLALVTINFRESLPEKFGGKAMFDRVAGEARAYYNANAPKPQ